jgi:hypothetical protein
VADVEHQLTVRKDFVRLEPRNPPFGEPQAPPLQTSSEVRWYAIRDSNPEPAD